MLIGHKTTNKHRVIGRYINYTPVTLCDQKNWVVAKWSSMVADLPYILIARRLQLLHQKPRDQGGRNNAQLLVTLHDE